ncbi:hypothetical protein PHLGIDRAFT_219210 [Phlebiopsis gigantea 11061_1 CR5-6]|uniref:Uncharacterized protein n=1 Tax=Phlebiopsis gigantea (strain 11061_1 CR5-6) TaxID=745531 RepID=A0A0C3SEJ2_PHLG1|nr:hypothetical protein PHLGIDRAFT_219210 [Phlebiopsis gigantea 11061_1 CR5-6]
MRIKVECSPPLPPSKVWFIVPVVSTVAELKHALWAELPGLQQSSTDNLTLVLDGFELIDSSSIDVIRDGELVTVKQTMTSTVKRKSTEEPSLPSPKRARRTVDPVVNISARTASVQPPQKPADVNKQLGIPKTNARGKQSSSSSSSSDSDSSSDSSSDSDSDSSADDSSSSDSSSAPSERPSKPATKSQMNGIPTQREPAASAKPVAAQHVPPGQGKAATQSRNARRRRKKMYERLPLPAEPLSVNETPLGPRQTARPESPQPRPATVANAAPVVMMASLSNKNKRKGFKQAMANSLPPKIVFSNPASAEEILPFSTTSPGEIQAAAPSIFPRLVAPSEKQANGQLPPNMFVTSIDVEEGLRKGKKKNKKKATPAAVRHETAEVEYMVLDYGEPDDHIPAQRDLSSSATATHKDWAKVESGWDGYAKIADVAQIKPGGIVGWKALGINPATYTPEWLVNVGQVVTAGDKVVVKPLHKPGDVLELGEEEAEISYDDETYDWTADVLNGDWRVI